MPHGEWICLVNPQCFAGPCQGKGRWLVLTCLIPLLARGSGVVLGVKPKCGNRIDEWLTAG